jgi:hypothetical protein
MPWKSMGVSVIILFLIVAGTVIVRCEPALARLEG